MSIPRRTRGALKTGNPGRGRVFSQFLGRERMRECKHTFVEAKGLRRRYRLLSSTCLGTPSCGLFNNSFFRALLLQNCVADGEFYSGVRESTLLHHRMCFWFHEAQDVGVCGRGCFSYMGVASCRALLFHSSKSPKAGQAVSLYFSHSLTTMCKTLDSRP